MSQDGDAALLTGLRVLLVEDELLISLMVEDALADRRCTVVGPFENVADALEAARTETIDFAILDVNIAGTKIYPVAEMLDSREIPFLLMSGYGLRALPANRQHWHVFSKPFITGELMRAVVRQVVARG